MLPVALMARQAFADMPRLGCNCTVSPRWAAVWLKLIPPWLVFPAPPFGRLQLGGSSTARRLDGITSAVAAATPTRAENTLCHLSLFRILFIPLLLFD